MTQERLDSIDQKLDRIADSIAALTVQIGLLTENVTATRLDFRDLDARLDRVAATTERQAATIDRLVTVVEQLVGRLEQ